MSIAYGQGWERTYPLGDYNSFRRGDLIPTPDGGFLLNSSVQNNPPPFDSVSVQYHLRKIAADGTAQWYKTHDELFGASVVAMWPVENNCLLFVTLENGLTTRLVKTDASFNPLWSQVLDAQNHKGYRTGLKTVAGGYVVVYQQNDAQFEPVRIIKTDLNGNLLWQNDFNIVVNFSYRDFVSDKQGNLFVFGEGGSPYGALAARISAAGNLLFTQSYPGAPSAISPVLLNDNLLAFLDFAGHLQFIDGAGQPVNSLDLTDVFYRMAATTGGNLIMCTQGNFPILQKMTPDGTVLWSHSYGDAATAYDKAPFVIWPLSDGGSALLFVAANSSLPFNVLRTDANGLIYTNRLYGNVFADLNNNCLNESGTDLPAPQLTVVAQSSDKTYLATTDSLGNYDMTLDTGTYLLRLQPYNALWNTCYDSLTVTFSAYDTLEWNSGINTEINCPWPTVQLSAPFLRRCFSNTYNVHYANEGSVTADSAEVTVELDPLLSLQSASLPYTSPGGNTYKFFVGDLAPLESGSFQLSLLLSCDAEPGQTHCSSAGIHITNGCPATGIETAIIRVDADCEGDSVAFSIKNIGGAPMLNEAEFVIIEDLIVMRSGQFQLPAQEETVVKCPANGATSRIYAGQAPGEPPFFAPTAAVEGCNGPVQPGFWNMFPENIANQSFDRDCQPNVGAIDPNDKQAVPMGYDLEHYIGRGVALDYKIRFQNTGTDTAFTVVVRDTLSPWLDAVSVRPGPASHPYTWQMLGSGVLQFRFENIFLPDSNTNLAASNGYVTFHIDQKPDVPLQTLIENRAAIYFDFNAPVLTNTTFHRVGEKFVTVGTWEPAASYLQVDVAPNPFDTETVLEIKGLRNDDPLTLQIFDLQGKMMKQMNSATQTFNVKKGDWPRGFYPFCVFQNGQLLGRGKLMVW